MRRLPGILLLTGAALVVIAALLVSGLRIALPHLDAWRPEILNKIESATGMPVEASQLSASWQNFGPTLEAHDIRAELKDGGEFSVKRVTLALGNVEATAEQIAVWLRKEDEEGFQRCPDIVLSSFLNGLIYEKRGKDESAPALEPERRINNNIVLKKLRIAFSLKTDDILAILTEQQFRVSMPEITAMMRAPDHKNFRECGDQFLRYFLRGLAARQHVKKG